jgi:hypothetical protein
MEEGRVGRRNKGGGGGEGVWMGRFERGWRDFGEL